MAIKILSVDDEQDLEALLTQYFRRKIRKGEYEFSFAHNGLEALRMMLDHPDFDIILSDINMPEMDGLTLLTKINEMRNPALKCIIVSAYGDMENIRTAMNMVLSTSLPSRSIWRIWNVRSRRRSSRFLLSRSPKGTSSARGDTIRLERGT